MKINFFIILIILICLTKSLYATKIVVIEIDELISQNDKFIKVIDKIEDNQKKYIEKFNREELALKDYLAEIKSGKLIYEEVEYNNMINDYNNKLNNFQNLINSFNQHYENEIIAIKNQVFKEIIILIENFVKNNNVDIVLDSTSYLVASNSINITEIIGLELKNKNLELEFKSFENN